MDLRRGSEWRRWDLHVHTPYSALNNGFGSDFALYAKALLTRAVERNIAVIGVTDYFSVEGYGQLKALINNSATLTALVGEEIAERASDLLILPNIELRTSTIVTRPDGSDSRVNFHVIFDDVGADALNEHFLRELKFTAISNPDSRDERWSLTATNLIALGQRLKQQQSSFRGMDDVRVGMLNAVIAHEDVTSVLQSQLSRFQDRYVLVAVADEDLSEINWSGQGHLTRKLYIQKSHMLFSGNAGTRKFALGGRHPTPDDFIKEFGAKKPCIHGSDAHSIRALFEPTDNKYMWVKADPTFQGLRQLLFEPDTRVYIGQEPPSLSRTRENGTKYMKEVDFFQEGSRRVRGWFSGNTPLNPGLIAIIGNKGGGKSALADVLAVLGNTAVANNCSFLTTDKFLSPRLNLANQFHARVTWMSGPDCTQSLADPVDPIAVELVKYIPQHFLERVCSELKESSETEFDRELMSVIFSHVTEPARLGKRSLRELIDHLTAERQRTIALLNRECSNVNAAIVQLEDQLSDDHRRRLEAKLAQRMTELESHDHAKPALVEPPAQNNPVSVELAELGDRIRAIEEQLEAHREIESRSAIQVAAADRLLARMDNLAMQVSVFQRDSLTDASILGIDVAAVAALTLNQDSIRRVRAVAVASGVAARNELSSDRAESVAAMAGLAAQAFEAKRLELDAPNRAYQEYLDKTREWEIRRADIEGMPEAEGSVVGLRALIAALDQIPAQLDAVKRQRLAIVSQIHEVKTALLGDYRRLYAAVQDFIDSHPISQQQRELQFSAAITVDDFAQTLLDFIHRGRRGSFQGDDEGFERLSQIVRGTDFESFSEVERFVLQVQDHLEHDRRSSDDRPVRLREQLKQDATPEQLYDYLYGLTYLKPRFELRWHDKPLDQLSPGERGTVLLVFYLLIDKSDVPLIIDQPEENLDNQTIHAVLVPAIRYAKDRRQIVIVTHNPNLAVVCDAEQIIHARIDKSDSNALTYTSGAIEDPAITQLVVDVLEGTKPAFDLRDARYEVLERLGVS